MEAGVGVNSPEFLQKKIERLKTALEEANVLMDRQVTERDEARAQLDGVKRENDELRRQLEEAQAAAARAAPVEADAAPAADPGVEQELRDRIAELEREPGVEQELRDRIAELQRDPAVEQQLRERIAELEREGDTHAAPAGDSDGDQELRTRIAALQGELESARTDLDHVRRDLDSARRDTDAARADAQAARAESTATARRPPPDAELPAPGPFVSQEVIRDALDNDSFVLFCQPVFSLQAERITQYELLLRLRDSDGRMVRPFGF